MKEMLGLGPLNYCIVDSGLPKFDKRVILLLYYLPHKLCFYPEKANIGPTFSRSPSKEIGKAISDQTILFDKDLARNVYCSQQYEIWMDSGGTIPLQSLWEFEDFEL